MDNTSIGERSALARFFRWLFSRRGLLSLFAFLVIMPVVLVLLFYAEEDWRGSYQWNKYRRQLVARGEKLDLEAFIPKPVPDGQNFAATPLIESWFEVGHRTATVVNFAEDDYAAASELVAKPEAARGDRRLMDLETWKLAFEGVRTGGVTARQEGATGKLERAARAQSAPAVLEGMAPDREAFSELRAASQRPYSRYPVQYDLENPFAILLPHLAKIKAASQRLQLQAGAELAAGQVDNALQDVQLLLCLIDSTKDEPFLISMLVRIACTQIAIQPIWEGLAEHRWSEAQLQALQSRLQQFDFLADLKRSLESEQAVGIRMVELTQKKGINFLQTLQDSHPPPANKIAGSVLAWFVPSGWYNLEKMNLCRLLHVLMGTALDTQPKRIAPSQVAENSRAFEQEINNPGILGRGPSAIVHHRFLATMLLPALGKTSIKAASAQTAVNEAALACALERYRLAKGQYPATLQALVPQFVASLPNDVVTGEPYKYVPADDGQFKLYSVGWNESDDGGTPGRTLFDDKEGDWVWNSAAE